MTNDMRGFSGISFARDSILEFIAIFSNRLAVGSLCSRLGRQVKSSVMHLVTRMHTFAVCAGIWPASKLQVSV